MIGYDARHREALTFEERIARGRRAADMLADEELWADAHAEFVSEWLAAMDSPARDAAWAKAHALEGLKHRLRVIVGDGQSAAAARDKANY